MIKEQPDTIPAPPVESDNPVAELRRVLDLLTEDRDRYKREAEELRQIVHNLEKLVGRYSIVQSKEGDK